MESLPVGIKAKEFLEQFGALLAMNGTAIETGAAVVNIDTMEKRNAMIQAGRNSGIDHKILRQWGITDGYNVKQVDIARVNQLAAYNGTGPIPGMETEELRTQSLKR